MILIDTSALYALADRADKNYRNARNLFDRALAQDERLITHNYIVVESMALVHNRLNFLTARKTAKEVKRFQVVWIDKKLHEKIENYYNAAGRRFGFVDCASFTVMEEFGIDTAFTFDNDFKKAGFKIYT